MHIDQLNRFARVPTIIGTSQTTVNWVGWISLSKAACSELSTGKKCTRTRLQHENIDVCPWKIIRSTPYMIYKSCWINISYVLVAFVYLFACCWRRKLDIATWDGRWLKFTDVSVGFAIGATSRGLPHSVYSTRIVFLSIYKPSITVAQWNRFARVSIDIYCSIK